MARPSVRVETEAMTVLTNRSDRTHRAHISGQRAQPPATADTATRGALVPGLDHLPKYIDPTPEPRCRG